MKQNLNKGEKIALKKLKSNDNILIKSADKGGAVVVWDDELYVSEASRQLSDTSTYIQLPEDPTTTNQKTISATIKMLINGRNALAVLKV